MCQSFNSNFCRLSKLYSFNLNSFIFFQNKDVESNVNVAFQQAVAALKRDAEESRRCKLSLRQIARSVLSFNFISRRKVLNTALINAKQYTRTTINSLKPVHYGSGVLTFLLHCFQLFKCKRSEKENIGFKHS